MNIQYQMDKKTRTRMRNKSRQLEKQYIYQLLDKEEQLDRLREKVSKFFTKYSGVILESLQENKDNEKDNLYKIIEEESNYGNYNNDKIVEHFDSIEKEK